MESKIQILGERLSPFVERVYLQVQAKGLGNRIDFPGADWDQIKTPEYLKINPYGKMPALKWGDFTLYESTVIMEFLEDQFPQKPMLPKDIKERARVRLVIRVLDMYYHVHTVALLSQVMVKERNQKFVDRHMAGANQALDVLEGLASGGQFIIGGKMTLADTTLFASIFLGQTFAPGFGLDYFAYRPKLKAWYQGMKEKPLFSSSNELRNKQVAGFVKARMKKRDKG